MTPPGHDPADDVDEARIEEQRRLSPIWIIPIIAVLVGGFIAWRVLSARGPEIHIPLRRLRSAKHTRA